MICFWNASALSVTMRNESDIRRDEKKVLIDRLSSKELLTSSNSVYWSRLQCQGQNSLTTHREGCLSWAPVLRDTGAPREGHLCPFSSGASEGQYTSARKEISFRAAKIVKKNLGGSAAWVQAAPDTTFWRLTNYWHILAVGPRPRRGIIPIGHPHRKSTSP